MKLGTRCSPGGCGPPIRVSFLEERWMEQLVRHRNMEGHVSSCWGDTDYVWERQAHDSQPWLIVLA